MVCGLVVAAGSLAPGASPAADAQPVLQAAGSESSLDVRAMQLASELRCLVCQNQTIADSDADLAVDLRRQVRELLQAGRSDDQIRAFMVERYGDYVLYRPPLNAQTALLWAGPALLLVGGVGTLLLVLVRRSRMDAARFEPDPDDDTPPDRQEGSRA
jgi:cytochrome c-type biogenesis protein CcmH